MRRRRKVPPDFSIFEHDPTEDEDELVKLIVTKIDAMKGPCQTILNMSLLEGMSLDSIFTELEGKYNSKGVIKSTKSRCLDKLRQALNMQYI